MRNARALKSSARVIMKTYSRVAPPALAGIYATLGLAFLVGTPEAFHKFVNALVAISVVFCFPMAAIFIAVFMVERKAVQRQDTSSGS